MESENCAVETQEQNEDFQRLHQLIAGAEDIQGFLNGMTHHAAATISRAAGGRIECAVTLHRRKRGVIIAGSSDNAILLDGVEQARGTGPSLAARQTNKPELLADTVSDQRWPQLSESLAAAGIRSLLAVPLPLGNEASAGLNFFAPATGQFTQQVIDETVIFADMASQALRLAIRIATADLIAQDLKAAMAHRTPIDIATGIIMGQNQCTQEEAMAMLKQASQNRNQKLNDLALDIIKTQTRADQTTPATHFEN